MASRNRVYLGFFLFIFTLVGVLIVSYRQQAKTDKLIKIQSFEACAEAGYPVMQSYPRQCTLPSGKFFVEQVSAQECRTFEDCALGFGCVNHFCQKLQTK